MTDRRLLCRRILAGLLLLPTARAAAAAQDPAGPFSLLGRRLFAAGGEELGRIVDLLVDGTGRPVAVVADVGGFMGIGMRRVGLAWALLTFAPDSAEGVRIQVDRPAADIVAAPEFRIGDRASILRPR